MKIVYEHPYVVRLCHWLTAISVTVLIGSGIEIFRAFPSFGAKIPERDVVQAPSWIGFGGWLGGALQLHFTFLWIFAATGVLYVTYQLATGNYKQVTFASSMSERFGPCFGTTFSLDQKHKSTGHTRHSRSSLTRR